MNMSELFDLKKIDLFCQRNNTVFVIKKHFYHSTERENLEKYHNILDITQMSMDSNELLKCADYLISDYSSVTADFLLLDKPILYYCFDLDEYLKEDRDMYWQFEDITPGPKVKNFNELLSALIRIIELNEDSYEAERNRVRRMFYAPESQCKSAKKILDQVANIIR